MLERVVPCLALSLACSSAAAAQVRAPGNTWPVTTPQAAGINGAVLDSVAAEIAGGAYGYIDRMLVIHQGRIVFDRSYRYDYDTIYGDSARARSALNAGHPTGPYNYFNPWWHPAWRRGDLHTLQSVTKTVSSIVIGVARTRGDFPSIDTPILRFFDTTKVANIDARKRRVTVRHLLTMTGGFDWNENLPYIDPRNNAVAMEASGDWVKYTIDLPMARDPGTEFNYSSGETELLAEIFFRATGVDIEEYAARHLFHPLGIERWYWKRIPTGLIDTEGGLYLEASDLARLWQLFLQNGVWNGERVLAADWVKESVTPAVRVANRPGSSSYGLKWWLHPHPEDSARFVWAGSGFGGQLPVAIPDRELVVVFNGWNILPGGRGLPLRAVLARIVKAVPPAR
ncbi:MAG: serine hydrolase domain-containing protein [Gemmatimonadales bacterium]